MKFKITQVLTFAVLLASSSLHSQSAKTKIKGVTFKDRNKTDKTQVRVNSTFLLLGTLNDYNGYKSSAGQNKFDSYYPAERPLMNYVDSIAKNDFKLTLTEEKNCFISTVLADKMNSYYTGTALNDSLFNTNEKKLSFLLGVYFRNGEKINADTYKIQLSNSPKHKNVFEFLKQLGCQNIYFKRLDNFPTIYRIYFQPTEIMKKYFATIASDKEKLLASKSDHSRSSDTLRKAYNERIEKENLKIAELFRQD